MFEQQSPSLVQPSLSTLHRPPPQTPPKQPSEQQSSAFPHATPSAKQAFVHWRTPAMPVTGSQWPVQQSPFPAQAWPPLLQAPLAGGMSPSRAPDGARPPSALERPSVLLPAPAPASGRLPAMLEPPQAAVRRASAAARLAAERGARRVGATTNAIAAPFANSGPELGG